MPPRWRGGDDAPMTSMSFSGWRVLVTGASRGIGAATARALLDAGARVALAGRDTEALQAVAAGRTDAHPLAAELTDDDARSALVERAIEALGGLDALVLAAGIADHRPFEALDEAALQRHLAVNLVAPLMLVREALPALRSGRGRVVFVGSTLGDRPAPRTVGYAASKAGLHAATRGLAVELAPAVTVNAVAPGVVDTAMARRLRLDPGEPEPRGVEAEARLAAQLETLRELHPLGRLGRPEEVARAVLYLLGAEWVTGSVLTIDGGLTAG